MFRPIDPETIGLSYNHVEVKKAIEDSDSRILRKYNNSYHFVCSSTAYFVPSMDSFQAKSLAASRVITATYAYFCDFPWELRIMVCLSIRSRQPTKSSGSLLS